MKLSTQANLYALGAIALWATLATLGVALSQVPAFALTGLALIIGSVPTWGHWRQWRVSRAALALGVYGLFGFHFLLFIALRHAPPVQANLVNYLWPLFIVVLAPLLLPGVRLRSAHVLAAGLGFLGAGLAILGGHSLEAAWAWGYLPALGSALIWATFSLGSRRMAQSGKGFPTAALGLFGLISGLLALACHVWLEPPLHLGLRDGLLIGVMGLGPLGGAFLLWDRALKLGDPRTIGVLSYLTPLASTLLLIAVTGRTLTIWIGLATVLIVGAALLAVRVKD
ncbi:putative Permease of the drug/metabolite transporter (DMT) superfamily [Thiomonas arsenitoxydans]|uniref:Permease of the drug/metabolite transporter (DMT) superfamily n=1 Tax=Thiomonas arsenitoxydans (strain DSM 22701 / CIP 110005 / 3As) TaxID=426114 RepID=D6CPK2_THIA3|nr:DMT family transporter [Thiomonas arsenitoxydans]CAZ87932.1 putative Permease of the drug/metabolite transporter (DMT) superfamily [Thiomonas arsenitoxydans]CQR26538.1 putative Permease of the drug/metabolite transporter (DMT) superfamily [Thiomonas arsenitoxydans]CQR27254.1 putative Permease of the drug/metabolite transporter (DMT) superfamily [Thiomonas arsenitoxydans]CQR31429.1 putative Permease of the drug/metabolite transporter (DMT) superfamily [Thiomonas arsenitoxydans]CQR31451.1 put